jgi:hypothetical protein
MLPAIYAPAAPAQLECQTRGRSVAAGRKKIFDAPLFLR